MDMRRQVGALTQVAKWPHFNVIFHDGMFYHGCKHRASAANLAVINDGIRTQHTIAANTGFTAQVCIGINKGVCANFNLCINISHFWVNQHHPFEQVLLVDTAPGNCLGLGQMHAGIDAHGFQRVLQR